MDAVILEKDFWVCWTLKQMLKRAAGSIIGICTVEKVWFYRLDPRSFKQIKEQFGPAICPLDCSFWDERQNASVATLMLIGNVTPISNVQIAKRDRRGWVVFKEGSQQTLL